MGLSKVSGFPLVESLVEIRESIKRYKYNKYEFENRVQFLARLTTYVLRFSA